MSRAAGLGLLLVLLGGALGNVGLIVVGSAVLGERLVSGLWRRYALRGVEYEREISTRRAVQGDELTVSISLWNRKALPVPSISVADQPMLWGGDPSRAHAERSLAVGGNWSLLWFERVRRTVTLHATQRGLFTWQRVTLSAEAPFRRDEVREQRDVAGVLVVTPRAIPVTERDAARRPGERQSVTRLFADPTRPAGVRPYRPGDEIRSIHWRATARTGHPLTKQYEPVESGEVLLAVDLQTANGPHWSLRYDSDLLEALCVTTASLARQHLVRGAACGVLFASRFARTERLSFVRPSSRRGQLARISDALAHVTPVVSAPFSSVLAAVPRRVLPGTTVVAISAGDPQPFVRQLRALARGGYDLRYVAVGPDASDAASRVRALAVRSSAARLQPSWETAEGLVLGA